MKKGIRFAFITAVFATLLCGCGKKKDDVKGDFQDVQGTVTTAADAESSTELDDEDFMYDSEIEIVDLPVDATIHYGDKTADLHFDLQDMPTEMSKPIEAKECIYTEDSIQAIAAQIFDDGQYEVTTTGAEPGCILATATFQQGTEKEVYQNGSAVGKVDGRNMELYFSQDLETSVKTQPMFSLNILDDAGDAVWSWYALQDDEIEGENLCDRREAEQRVDEYLKKWGFEDYECVNTMNLGDWESESPTVDGYSFTYSKKIGSAHGAAYDNNCFYITDDPHPTYGEQILVYYSSAGLQYVQIGDSYEITGEAQPTTIINSDQAIEKGTACIEKYLEAHPDDYSIYEYEYKSVWNVIVDLVYIPVQEDETISYVPVYTFALKDSYMGSKHVIGVISAEDGESFVDYDYMYDPDGTGAKG